MPINIKKPIYNTWCVFTFQDDKTQYLGKIYHVGIPTHDEAEIICGNLRENGLETFYTDDEYMIERFGHTAEYFYLIQQQREKKQQKIKENRTDQQIGETKERFVGKQSCEEKQKLKE